MELTLMLDEESRKKCVWPHGLLKIVTKAETREATCYDISQFR